MSKPGKKKFISFFCVFFNIWVSNKHIMGLKETLILIIMFIAMKFVSCQNLGKIHSVGKGIYRVGETLIIT